MFNSCPFYNNRMPNGQIQTKKPLMQPTQQMHQATQAAPQFPIMPPPFEQPPATLPQQSTLPPKPISAPVFYEDQPKTPVMSTDYTQGFLQTQIGKRVKITFLVGNTITVDRSGILTEVGVNYVILRDVNTGNDVLCDLFTIKFVLFYQ